LVATSRCERPDNPALHQRCGDYSLANAILRNLEIFWREIENSIALAIDDGDVDEDAGGDRLDSWLLTADQAGQGGYEEHRKRCASHGTPRGSLAILSIRPVTPLNPHH
jgi:hypothetical protein